MQGTLKSFFSSSFTKKSIAVSYGEEAIEQGDDEEANKQSSDEEASEEIATMDLTDQNDSNDEDQLATTTSNSMKKRKYSHDKPRRREGGLSKFKPIYATKYANDFIENSTTKGAGSFRCRACNEDISFGKKGEEAIKRHIARERHIENVKATNKNLSIAPFIKRKTTSEENRSVGTELAYAYHMVKHNHSLNSMQCTSKLVPMLFTGSVTAERFASGKTKTTALIKGVLHPFIMNQYVKKANQHGYSVAFDSTPHMMQRLYAIVIRFFDGNKIQNKLVQLVPMTSEKAVNMYTLVKEILQNNELELNKIISFTADNTNSNFGGAARGGQNNVYALWKKDNNSIIGISCSAHIIHNTARNAASKMEFDFEAFALSIVGYFSGHAQRWESYCEKCSELEIEPKKFPHHVNVRWLTLGRLCERIIDFWVPLEEYFTQADDAPKHLREIFQTGSVEQSMEAFAVLNFANYVLGRFNKFNASTQSHTFTIADLSREYEEFMDLLESLEKDKNFGGKTLRALENFTAAKLDNNRSKVEKMFMKFYADSLTYFDKWFQQLAEITNNVPLKWLSFEGINFTVIHEAYKNLFTCSDEEYDNLYEEVLQIQSTLKELNKTPFAEKNIEEKWATLFRNKKIVLVRKLVTALLSIFPSNAFCESIFSVVNGIWTDERNSFHADTVNALVSIKENSEFKCSEALDLFISQPELLQKAKRNDKY